MMEYEKQSNAPSQIIGPHPVSHNVLNRALYQKEKIRMKNMHQFPAVSEDALKHQKANMFGYRSTPSETSNERICSCCGQSVHLQIAPLCNSLESTMDRKQGDYGVPYEITSEMTIFFQLIKMLIIYLLLRLILIQGFQIWAIADSHLLAQNTAEYTFNGITAISIWPGQRFASQQLLQIESFLNLAYVLVIIVFFSIYRFTIKKYFQNRYYQTYSQDKFTILVENIPILPFIKTEQELNNEKAVPYHQMLHIKKGQVDESQIVNTQNTSIIITEALRLFFNKKAKKWKQKVYKKAYENLEQLEHNQIKYYEKVRERGKGWKYENKPVRSVTLCFDLADLEKVKYTRQKLMNEHAQSSESDAYLDRQSRNYPPNQIQMLGEKQIQLQKNFSTLMNPDLTLSHFLGKAFVSFQHEQIKNYFISEHNSDLKLLYDDKQCMTISQAPSAEDVEWFNMQNNRKSLVSIILDVIISFIFVMLGWSIVQNFQQLRIFYGFNNINFNSQGAAAAHGTFIAILVFSGICILVQFLKWLLKKWIDLITRKAFFVTKSNLLTVKMLLKIAFYVLFFIYSASILCEYFTFRQKSWDEIAVIITLFVAFCMIIQTLTSLLQFGKLIQNIKLCLYYSSQTVQTYQVKLNKMYQFQKYDISQRFSFYIVWLFVASYYNSVSPLFLLVVIILFIANFWIDKLNLLRRCSNPIGISKRLGTLMLRAMEWDIIVFSLGNMTSMSVAYLKQPPLQDYHSYLSSWLRLTYIQMAFIGFLIAIVYKLIAEILGWLIPERHDTTKSYSETCNEFRYKYWNENPATRLSYQGRYEKSKKIDEAYNTTFIHELYPQFSLDFLSAGELPNDEPNNIQPGVNEEINLSKEYSGKKSRRSSKKAI